MGDCVLLGVFLVLILCHQSLSSCETVVKEGMCLEETTKNWTEASDSCTLAVFNTSLSVGVFILGLPMLDHRRPLVQRTESHDIHWIGATGEFTPWFKLIGCFLYRFVEKNASITDATSKISLFTKCYQICKEYSLFGINNAICFCANNAAFGKIHNGTCVLKNSFSIKNDIIGTGNTVNSYHAFAVYRKVERITNLEDTLGECLIETVNGNETFPCDSADNTRRTWAESFAKSTYLNGKKMNILPRWLPFVRRLMINWNDGSSSLEKGTVCISVREQNGVYEAIPRHCQGKLTSICQDKRTDAIFRHGSKVDSQETPSKTNFKDPVFSSLSKVTSQHNFSNSKEPVFRSWNKVTPQQALPVSSSKDPVFRGWNKVTPTQDLPVSNSK
ncbi:uncharacterized protein LOC134229361, partial [Saccostrea cucullata]|uniref:uncharacterized protein LOC134229361 n=1 Tax=Saccostrea cuccullata TaxID=36930 RepID=UPI002ED5EF63